MVFPLITCMEELMVYLGRVDAGQPPYPGMEGDTEDTSERSGALSSHFSHKP